MVSMTPLSQYFFSPLLSWNKLTELKEWEGTSCTWMTYTHKTLCVLTHCMQWFLWSFVHHAVVSVQPTPPILNSWSHLLLSVPSFPPTSSLLFFVCFYSISQTASTRTSFVISAFSALPQTWNKPKGWTTTVSSPAFADFKIWSESWTY